MRLEVETSDAATSQGLPAATGSPEGDMDQILLHGLQRAPSLPTLRVQASGFQNCGRIDFCCFKSPHWWSFVTAATGN